MKKKVLICGSTGFIGKNIVDNLCKREDLELIAVYFNSEPVDYPNVKSIRADLTRVEDVERVVKGVDVIIQAAATTSGSKDIIERPYYHVTDNAVMNSLIFRAAHENGVSHVIFFSCSVMYQLSQTPLKETDFKASDEIFPKYFGVGWTKVYIEKMCEFFSRIGKTQFTVIRHSNIYGPFDKFDLEKSHVLGATITKVMSAEEKGEIVVWGAGEEERDLLYISDLVNFVEQSILYQKSKFEIVNVGLGKSIAIKDLVKKIVELSGKKLKIHFDLSKPSINTRLCLDISKAKQIYNWEPLVPLDQGIKNTIHWYKSYY